MPPPTRSPPSGWLPVLTRRLAQLTAKEPEHAAHLLRTWLTEEKR